MSLKLVKSVSLESFGTVKIYLYKAIYPKKAKADGYITLQGRLFSDFCKGHPLHFDISIPKRSLSETQRKILYCTKRHYRKYPTLMDMIQIRLEGDCIVLTILDIEYIRWDRKSEIDTVEDS